MWSHSFNFAPGRAERDRRLDEHKTYRKQYVENVTYGPDPTPRLPLGACCIQCSLALPGSSRPKTDRRLPTAFGPPAAKVFVQVKCRGAVTVFNVRQPLGDDVQKRSVKTDGGTCIKSQPYDLSSTVAAAPTYYRNHNPRLSSIIGFVQLPPPARCTSAPTEEPISILSRDPPL